MVRPGVGAAVRVGSCGTQEVYEAYLATRLQKLGLDFCSKNMSSMLSSGSRSQPEVFCIDVSRCVSSHAGDAVGVEVSGIPLKRPS